MDTKTVVIDNQIQGTAAKVVLAFAVVGVAFTAVRAVRWMDSRADRKTARQTRSS